MEKGCHLLWMHLASKEKSIGCFSMAYDGNTPLTQLLCRQPVCWSSQPKLPNMLLLLTVISQNESIFGMSYKNMPIHTPFLLFSRSDRFSISWCLHTTYLFIFAPLLLCLFAPPVGGATSDSFPTAAILIYAHIMPHWGHKLLLNQGSITSII